ncbi:hypothetical protein NL676_002259 [Syzygium grande]|nr:hypothetical protein NL676_002259 [Syzygium grande]
MHQIGSKWISYDGRTGTTHWKSRRTGLGPIRQRRVEPRAPAVAATRYPSRVGAGGDGNNSYPLIRSNLQRPSPHNDSVGTFSDDRSPPPRQLYTWTAGIAPGGEMQPPRCCRGSHRGGGKEKEEDLGVVPAFL